jgi:hypothetical protein
MPQLHNSLADGNPPQAGLDVVFAPAPPLEADAAADPDPLADPPPPAPLDPVTPIDPDPPADP